MLAISRKKGSNKILIFILIIAVIVTMLPILSMADSGNDITNTDAVKFNGFEMYRNDILIASESEGSLITSTADAIKIGESIDVRYFWEVNQTANNDVKDGSYFTIDLPDVFEFDPFTGASLKSDKGQVIGTIDVKKDVDGVQKLIITLNNKAIEGLPIDGGWIQVSGKLSEELEDVETIIFHGITIDVDVSTDESTGGTTPGTGGNNPKIEPKDGWLNTGGEPTLDKTLFGKKYNGDYNKNTGKAGYTLFANYENYRYKFADSTSYSAIEDVLIEDILPENVLYAGELKVTIPFYTVKAEYTTYASIGGINDVAVSVNAINPSQLCFNFYTANVTEQFTLCKPENPMIGYDDFKAFIKNQGPMSYGIWQNKAIVINVGEIQGNLNMGVTWEKLQTEINKYKNEGQYIMYNRNASGQAIDVDGNVYAGTTDPAIIPSKSAIVFNEITDEIKEKTIEAYKNFYGNGEEPSDDALGQAVGFTVSFKTDISGESRSLQNSATLHHSTTEKTATSTTVTHKQISGGANLANPGDIILEKFDGDTYKPLAGVQFKLQRWNQTTNQYEELAENDKGFGTFTTDADGRVIFRQLSYGKYKIIEVKGLDGYTDEVSYYNHETKRYQDTFELAESVIIEFSAYNYKENILGDEGYSTDDEGDVLGEDADPDSEAGSVMGEEAKTADVANLFPLLLALLVVMIILTLAVWQSQPVGKKK